ncbi:ribonuclease III [Fusibacter paucivorans]|uniref:Ribonuclease 3 n=1 Tax=Fusibacter paucivorans TaxID=76009 RepID=A0ABS5PQY9_9FIRM|nr:ribonuclease III [Fusibacter paucivorans]MBS7527463.1 ribonuclease III [Fusibacter paucivorans]
MSQSLRDFQEKLGYQFNDIDYLRRALTHSSYANENKKDKIKNNERLEFLGDSVLGLVVSEYLYSHFPNLAEGQLTKVRARIVCESSLGEAAVNLGIGHYMFFGRGEEMTGGRERTSILSDAFEALIAAMYLDGDIDVVRKFVLTHMDSIIIDAIEGKLFIDYKTRLQEVIQIKKGNRIKYEIFKEEGPDHSKEFFTHVKLNDDIIGVGKGRSKKESEQAAAKEGLKYLQDEANK